jgi:hypothetical protein
MSAFHHYGEEETMNGTDPHEQGADFCGKPGYGNDEEEEEEGDEGEEEHEEEGEEDGELDEEELDELEDDLEGHISQIEGNIESLIEDYNVEKLKDPEIWKLVEGFMDRIVGHLARLEDVHNENRPSFADKVNNFDGLAEEMEAEEGEEDEGEEYEEEEEGEDEHDHSHH